MLCGDNGKRLWVLGWTTNDDCAFVHQSSKDGGKMRSANAARGQTASAARLFMLHQNTDACVASGTKAPLPAHNDSFNRPAALSYFQGGKNKPHDATTTSGASSARDPKVAAFHLRCARANLSERHAPSKSSSPVTSQ